MLDSFKRNGALFLDRIPFKLGWPLFGAVSSLAVVVLGALAAEVAFYLTHGRW